MKKNFLKSLKFTTTACAITMATLFSFTSCSGGSDDDDGKYTIVCFGDSLTAGTSAVTEGVDDKTKSYPAYLKEKLTDDVEVINAGVKGDTTDDALARIEKDVLEKDPDMVIICIGANDFLQSSADDIRNSTTMLKIQDNIIKMVKKLDTRDRIVFVANFYSDESAIDMLNDKGITDPDEQKDIIDVCDTVFRKIDDYDDETSEIKNLYDLAAIDDIWLNIWNTENMSDDGIHPLASGYKIMADNYFEWFGEFLSDLGYVK